MVSLSARRQTAARIIADLATTWDIGDLIVLLESEDGIVRRYAATALHRLTEVTHGTTPEQWQESVHPEALEQWKVWWMQNHDLYPTLEDLQQQDVNENSL